MTVAELIAKLQEMPQDMRIVISDKEYGVLGDVETMRQILFIGEMVLAINHPLPQRNDETVVKT